MLAQQAFHDVSLMLRPEYQKQVTSILHDPEASENDKYVALQFLRNSDISAKGVLPTVPRYRHGDYHEFGNEAALSKGMFNTYIENDLRYSQNAPLDMYKKINTGSKLPTQIDLYQETKSAPHLKQAEKFPR